MVFEQTAITSRCSGNQRSSSAVADEAPARALERFMPVFSPSRSPLGKSKKRMRESGPTIHRRSARTIGDAVADDEELEIAAGLPRCAPRSVTGIVRGDHDRECGHRYPATPASRCVRRSSRRPGRRGGAPRWRSRAVEHATNASSSASSGMRATNGRVSHAGGARRRARVRAQHRDVSIISPGPRRHRDSELVLRRCCERMPTSQCSHTAPASQ